MIYSSTAISGESDGMFSALNLLRGLAKQGNSNAQNILGAMYLQGGNGVKQNYIRAHMWFDLSDRNGNKDGGIARDLITKDMTPIEIAEAQKKARECIKKDYKGCD
tara:strand:- start:871 stop:1188 length:318 start_codon:yes stop_codon:yes gene_type:complete